MATKTQRKARKSKEFQEAVEHVGKAIQAATDEGAALTHDQKNAIAKRLTAALRGEVIISYEPETFDSVGDWNDYESRGHLFICRVAHKDGQDDLEGWALDDREGGIQHLFAKMLRQWSTMFGQMAETIENLPAARGKVAAR
jgi:hypothetical protein